MKILMSVGKFRFDEARKTLARGSDHSWFVEGVPAIRLTRIGYLWWKRFQVHLPDQVSYKDGIVMIPHLTNILKFCRETKGIEYFFYLKIQYNETKALAKESQWDQRKAISAKNDFQNWIRNIAFFPFQITESEHSMKGKGVVYHLHEKDSLVDSSWTIDQNNFGISFTTQRPNDLGTFLDWINVRFQNLVPQQH